MPELAQRAYFVVCLTLGRLLRAGRYSKVRIVSGDGALRVIKYRRVYAPILVRLGNVLVRLLDTGVRVLPQREWEERERRMYREIHGAAIAVEPDGTLALPCFPGRPLAALLEDPRLQTSQRRSAMRLAVAALVRFHHLGHTHGDAMADNVMIDLDAGVARWFDFETVHDPAPSIAWRRADDVRALLATCLLRTPPAELADTLRLVLDLCDDEVIRILATSFTSVFRRPLTFHLGQAPMAFGDFRRVARMLTEHTRAGPL